MKAKSTIINLSLAASLLACLSSSPALSSSTAPPAVEPAIETVIITGTRVSGRTLAQSSAPIDVITPQALAATGTTELATALARALPALNFPRPAITDGTDAVRPAQLRGLAPDQVLVLVNGKRRHTTALINLNGSQGRGSSPVDLNAIPVSAIERVEVLRDGASAQYGSDAIAGVINVVLKAAADGGSLRARAGGHTAGDGALHSAAADAGFGLPGDGFLQLAAQATRQGQTNRAASYQGVREQRFGDPRVEALLLSYNAESQPGADLALYSFGSYGRRDVLSNGYFRWDTDPRNVPEIHPFGFLPQINNLSRDRALVAGLRLHTAGGWDLDFSLNHGGNQLVFDVRNSVNRSLGTASPTTFHAGTLEVSQNLLNLDARRQLELDWLARPLAFAVGAEWRRESFALRPGEPASYADTGLINPDTGARTPGGSQVFPGFKPGDSGSFDRHSHAFYVDLEAGFSERLSAGLALRHEDYSDFGTTTSGKLSARHAFGEALALRGTLATGFRAPSLQQQYFQSTATNHIDNKPFDVVTFRVDHPTAVALGAEPLKAERSVNASVGLVLQPSDALYVTVDAYRIDVADRIALSENLIGDAVRGFLEARGIFGANGGRYFTNALDTRTQGVDVVGSHRRTLGAGRLETTLGYHYGKTEVRHIAPNPPGLETSGLNLERIGRVEIGRFTVGAPRDKLLLGASWRSTAWTLHATATRYGRFTVYSNDPALDQTYSEEWTLDLALTRHAGRWDFTLGADNVLDAYPDRQRAGQGERTYLPYSSASPFGFNGSFVFGRIDYRW